MEPEHTDQPEEELERRGPVATVIRINLIILAVYALLAFVSEFIFNSGSSDIDEVAVIVGMAMMAQGVINFILSILYFIMRKSGYGKGALLCGLLFLIIGFSTCTAFISFH